MYFSSSPCDRYSVCRILLIFVMEQAAYSQRRSMIHTPSQDIGRRVDSSSSSPLLLAMEHVSHSSSSSISQVGCILYQEDGE